MQPRQPIAHLPTHEVINTPPHMGDQDLWSGDRALRHWAGILANLDHAGAFARLGAVAGQDETFERANDANRHGPELHAFDRYGMRLNAVRFHPAYHDLMDTAVTHRLHNFAWHHEGHGGHAGQGVLTYQFSQPEGGVMCPMAMTYSAIPALRTTPEIAAEWMPRILSDRYDPRDIPAAEKSGALVGMFMTEKQGGSDVRANATTARPEGAATGPGAGYLLTGHKFFCSAPMCDAFLVLAHAHGGGLSCFLVPRWRPDGTRNGLFIQRMKDKLGNRSNASTEMEFHDTYGQMVGAPGRGIRTIIDMVTGNRIYCAMSSAGIMRQALVQALHHAAHRSAFQKRLIRQPLMINVLADMAIEVEGALALGMRIAQAMDRADDPAEAALARIGTAIAKYWNCKRCPALVAEALECHGGPGYVEDCVMPRLYREAPLNSIWEGSGNVMCLDVLRAMTREPQALPALMVEIGRGRGMDGDLDRAIDALDAAIQAPGGIEAQMRAVTEAMALTLQGSLLVRHAPDAVARAFCVSRLGSRYTGAFGTLPAGLDLQSVVDRALPA